MNGTPATAGEDTRSADTCSPSEAFRGDLLVVYAAGQASLIVSVFSLLLLAAAVAAAAGIGTLGDEIVVE